MLFKANSPKIGLGSMKSYLVGTVCAAALFTSGGLAYGQDTSDCLEGKCDGGVKADSVVVYDGASRAQDLPVGANTEIATVSADPGSDGFSISFDGERIAGSEKPVDVVRQTDVDLSRVDIQVKFDGLGVKPVLNVSTKDLRHSYQGGDTIEFVATTNYPAWIARAELRIFDAESTAAKTPIDVVPVEGPGGKVTWVLPQEGSQQYSYVLRVYDPQGRFDETLPLGIRRTSQDFATHETAPQEEPVSAGDGDDRTAVRNIPVYGGAVTVYGRDVPAGYSVRAIGEGIPIDSKGAFVVQRILPPGEHVVDVTVKGHEKGDIEFARDINIPDNEWFYVGLADLTVGRRFGGGELVDAGSSDYDDTYTKGRLAFYLKGKIKGKYILTAAADTGEEDVRNIFRNFDEKDPRQVLRRIDPDKYYPVYGDDSTTLEDAPTQGRFYVRLERGKSHVMWGNYKTTIRNTEFARNERALYGASGVYKSEKTTKHGDAKVAVEAYASQPDTLPQRDELRGTGGSVYFLTRQDLTRGSETITVEVRDRVTGIVRSRTILRYGEDYEINYIQGVVILKQPLPSSASSSTIVTSGTLSGDENHLTVQYEYTPPLGDVDGYSYGGRAQAWIGDNVRVGVSGISENTGVADQEVIAADVHVKLAENSYVEAEVAQTDGPGFGSSNSINGGLTIASTGTSGTDRKALGVNAKLHVDLSDINPDYNGAVGLYYQRREAGFSSLGYNTAVTQRIWGAYAKGNIREDVRFLLNYEDFEDNNGQEKREGDAQLEFDLNEFWTIGMGVKHTHLDNPISSLSNGSRTDIGAKISYKPNEDSTYYIFGQGTAHRSGNLDRNDRIGVGFKRQFTEKLGAEAEVSYGTLGWGGLAAVNYSPTADDKYYVGYRIDPSRKQTSTNALDGTDLGGFVMGARHRYNDIASAYLENSYDIFGKRRSLTSTYGVTLTPTAKWTVDGGVEYGDVEDPNGESIERVAVSASVSYKDEENVSWNLKGEARFEDSDDPAKDRNTFLVSAGVLIKHNENWRFLGNIDAAISDSDQTSILNGDYVKGSIGYAYRPTDNDRLNALFKYTFLYDLPGPDQVTTSGSTLGPAQRSHILSADVIYDVNQHLTLGAKYGFRIGQVSTTRDRDDFIDSSAHLGVVRADYHVVKNWDVFAEARILHTPEIDTTYYGAVAGVYRHFGNNLKVGVGYNFGQFSDEVSDLTFDDEGIFVNIIGKF